MSHVEQAGIGSAFFKGGQNSNDPDNLAHVHFGSSSAMSAFEMATAMGNGFIATDMNTLSDAQTKEYAIRTSDAYDQYHMKYEVGANNAVIVQLYRDPNISDAGYAAGSDIATQNRNDNYSDLYSDCHVMADPTLVTTLGVPWDQHYAGAFRSPSTVASEMVELAQNSNYIVQVIGTAANTIMSIGITFGLFTDTTYTPS